MLGERDPFAASRGEPLRAALPDVSGTAAGASTAPDCHTRIPEEAPDRLALAVAELLAR